jgi:hypothetical protein
VLVRKYKQAIGETFCIRNAFAVLLDDWKALKKEKLSIPIRKKLTVENKPKRNQESRI